MDTKTLKVGQIVRISGPNIKPFDAIVEDVDRDGYVLVKFKGGYGVVSDWVTPDMVEIPQ